MSKFRLALLPLVSGVLLAAVPYIASVVELEPNDTFDSAQLVALEDTVLGAIDPPADRHGQFGDVDYFRLRLDSGTVIDFNLVARRGGSHLSASLGLWDENRAYLQDSFAAEGGDPRLRGIRITATGDYFVRINAISGGGPQSVYSLALTIADTGPGDPTTLRPGAPVDGWHAPILVAGPGGDVYLLVPRANGAEKDIWRVPADGDATLIASTDGNAFTMALDALGDLLLPEPEHQRVLRVSPRTGAVSHFTIPEGFIPIGIAIGTDTDVWISGGDWGSGQEALIRFDQWGRELERVTLEHLPASITAIAVSPSGVLHFTDAHTGVYRVSAGGVAELVFAHPAITSIAFDAAGEIFLSTWQLGLIRLTASYQVRDDPFAVTDLRNCANAAFLRDAADGLTNRLVASAGAYLVEMNAQGISTRGSGPDLHGVTPDAAAGHLLRNAGLSEETTAGLDFRGNANDQFDVGDLSALVASY